MKKIHESKNVKLKVELDSNNSFDNIFGKLKFVIDGKDIATNQHKNNLSYFYVDCESLKLILENNINVENKLFFKENNEILLLWNEWENYKLNFDSSDEEPENVKFFDRNYFRTGNIFNSFFFDEIMIFYVIENDLVKFKYWYKIIGFEIYEIKVNKDELMSCLNSFLIFFNAINNDFKNNNVNL